MPPVVGQRALCGGKFLRPILEAELVTVDTTEGAAYGAALLAGVGAGPGKMFHPRVPQP